MAGGKWQTVFVNSYNTAPLLPTGGWPCPPRHLQLLQPETYSMEKIELFATDSCKENYCGSGNLLRWQSKLLLPTTASKKECMTFGLVWVEFYNFLQLFFGSCSLVLNSTLLHIHFLFQIVSFFFCPSFWKCVSLSFCKVFLICCLLRFCLFVTFM